MGTINKTTSEINTLLNQVGTTSSEVAGLDTRLDTAEGTLVTLDGRVDTLETTVTGIPGTQTNGNITTGTSTVPLTPSAAQLKLAAETWGGSSVVPDANTVTTAGIANDGVTDVGNAIRALITTAKASASEGDRWLLKIYPGVYKISGVLDLGPHVNLDMRGAKLLFTGTTLDSKLTIGSLTEQARNAHYLGIHVDNENLHSGDTGHKFREGLIGVDIINCFNSTIEITEIKNFTRCLRLAAYNALYTAYNNIYINSLVVMRVGVTIESLGLAGWVNENKFFGGNWLPTTDLNNYGSGFAIEFKTSGVSPYVSLNQNVFFGPSFQLSSPVAWSSAKPGIRQFNRFYNPTTFIEYEVKTAGESQVAGTNVPTHTSGEFTDNAGMIWEYIGPVTRSPVFCNGAGGYNRIYGARWELGFGPFMVAKGNSSSTTGAQTRGNIFEVYQKQGVTPIYIGADEMDESMFDNHPIASAFSEMRSYDKSELHSVSFNNLHLRAVESSAGVTVPGFENGNNAGTTADKNISSGAVEILFDGLHFKSSNNGIALFFNTSVAKRFEISYSLGSTADNRGRTRIRCLDSTKTFYSDLNTIGFARAWGGFENTNVTSTEYSQSNTSTGNRAFATRHDTKYARLFFQGETTSKTIIKSISVTAKVSSLNNTNKCLVDIENRLPLDFDKRYSNGTPIAGAFFTLGDQIINLSGTATQPLYWTVTTTGYLCKAWVTATLYVVGSLVNNSGTNYRCITSHTSSAAFATDSANWVSVGTPAVLTASTQTY